MREILFRGKRLDDEGWEYGGYACTESKRAHIIYNQTHSINLEGHTVYPDTVGQYTGLTDKNGRKIFEGDIVKYTSGSECFYHKVVFETRNFCCYFGIVISDIETWGFGMEVPPSMLEVIGNIHDNPELITCGANSEK